MEIKRAAELSLCALLREALPDLAFFPAKGGGDDVTPTWQSNHDYSVGDVLRPTNLALTKAVVINVAGNSGATEPSFDDVPGSIITGPPDYETTNELAVSTAADTGYPKAPFAAIMFEPAEKMISYEDTDLLHGLLVWVTRADETNVVTHSKDVKRIYDALQRIGAGYDIMRRIVVHGVDITSTSEFDDNERQAHGDTIEFLMGVTAKPGQG